jgi:hypothetical protein
LRSGCKSETGLSASEFNKTLSQRFADKCGAMDASECIPWIAARTRKGYGILQVGGPKSRKTTAHRIAWVLAYGDLSPEMVVMHRCDNPSCVNIDHLAVGTQQQNLADMKSKGRHQWRDPQKMIRWSPGDVLPWQKLNLRELARIRFLRDCGHPQHEVAAQLNISRSLISLIESGKIKHAQTQVVQCT